MFCPPTRAPRRAQGPKVPPRAWGGGGPNSSRIFSKTSSENQTSPVSVRVWALLLNILLCSYTFILLYRVLGTFYMHLQTLVSVTSVLNHIKTDSYINILLSELCTTMKSIHGHCIYIFTICPASLNIFLRSFNAGTEFSSDNSVFHVNNVFSPQNQQHTKRDN